MFAMIWFCACATVVDIWRGSPLASNLPLKCRSLALASRSDCTLSWGRNCPSTTHKRYLLSEVKWLNDAPRIRLLEGRELRSLNLSHTQVLPRP